MDEDVTGRAYMVPVVLIGPAPAPEGWAEHWWTLVAVLLSLLALRIIYDWWRRRSG